MRERQLLRKMKGYRIGKAIGFGASLTVFATIFYFLMSFLDKMPPQVQYVHFVSAALSVYIVSLVIWTMKGRKI